MSTLKAIRVAPSKTYVGLRASHIHTSGFVAAPSARVANGYVPVRADDEIRAALFVDDLDSDTADYTVDYSRYNTDDTMRNMRIQTSDGIHTFNPSVDISGAFFPAGGTGDEVWAAVVEVELSRLSGDFILMNGTHKLLISVTTRAAWYKQVTTIAAPALNIYLLLQRNIVDEWTFVLARQTGPAGQLIDCIKSWRLTQNTADCEGTYTARYCSAAACADPATCAKSVGGTCRVRWAGATWP